jgi:hypothetical protein
VVAIAATFLSLQYKASAMLFALLLGMALNFLARGRCLPVSTAHPPSCCASGVALPRLAHHRRPGAWRLGWGVVVAGHRERRGDDPAPASCSRAGPQARQRLRHAHRGRRRDLRRLGALAIASILPKHKNAERDASFTVIGVTALSTLAMILYPLVVGGSGLDHRAPASSSAAPSTTWRRWSARVQRVEGRGRHGHDRQAAARGDCCCRCAW